MTSEYGADMNLSRATWRKPRRSQGNGNCVEVADGFPDVVPVRDSKNSPGPALIVRAAAWQAFVEHVKD
ncbi:DUF397 domain-containing protein [Streptomyces sp. 4N509B]|uniref:DUF397 domain-containing protein n=1 Tax=Streptomyces sp. 4N509B TaxID=3457413 RepID=UPI003FD2184C